MAKTPATHIGFSDESHWNKGRYRSLALVTLNRSELQATVSELYRLLDHCDVTEFAWKNLRSDRYRFLAQEFCKFAVDLANAEKIRVDTLIWDTHDSRHGIPGRDDAANLARMYYHLMRNVIANRWPKASHWEMYPDRRTGMDWETLENCLPSGPSRHINASELGNLLVQEIRKPSIKAVASSAQPLVQLADLFAGLAAFSWNEHAAYERWKGQSDMLSQMFDDAQPSNLSNSQAPKARTLLHFTNYCKRRIAISHNKREGLRTRNPSVPINFWRYVPQREDDKAPLRPEKASNHRRR